MAPPKLTPTDSHGAVHQQFHVDGTDRSYHYLLAIPSTTPVATIFLIHGFPEFHFSWRYQVPFLLSVGLRCVIPDMQGYALSSAPQDITAYTFKTAASDLAALAASLGCSSSEGGIILGGHDWGGMVVYRFANHYPSLIRGVFSICTPYVPPSPKHIPLEAVTQRLPNFKYQLQFASGDIEKHLNVEGKDEGNEVMIRGFLNGMFGGKPPDGKPSFTTESGTMLEGLDTVGSSPLLDEAEREYYVKNFCRQGMRGPCNWYRTREANFEDEKAWFEDGKKGPEKITCPVLFVAATKDTALPPSMSEGMDKHFEEGRLRRGTVESSHWALVEKADVVNKLVGDWLNDVGLLGQRKSSL